MYQYAYEESTLENVYESMEQYFSKREAQRDLYEAMDTLNSVTYEVGINLKLKMGEVLHEVLLVDIESNTIVRTIHRDEIMTIFNSLKRLLDLKVHFTHI